MHLHKLKAQLCTNGHAVTVTGVPIKPITVYINLINCISSCIINSRHLVSVYIIVTLRYMAAIRQYYTDHLHFTLSSGICRYFMINHVPTESIFGFDSRASQIEA